MLFVLVLNCGAEIRLLFILAAAAVKGLAAAAAATAGLVIRLK